MINLLYSNNSSALLFSYFAFAATSCEYNHWCICFMKTALQCIVKICLTTEGYSVCIESPKTKYQKNKQGIWGHRPNRRTNLVSCESIHRYPMKRSLNTGHLVANW